MSPFPFAPLPFPAVRRLAAAVSAALLAAFATGCASTRSVYGEQAHFSPAYRGYVMAEKNGSDDPDTHQTVLLLRHPVTGKKLHCQEEVTTWRELYEDVAANQLRDGRAAIAAGVTAGALYGPVIAVRPVGALALTEGLYTTEGLYDLLRSENARELFAGGVGLYKRKRFQQASVTIERALAKDGSVGTLDKAYYYLGLSYAEQGKDERARVALGAFVDRAGVRDVDAYREAEGALERLGVTQETCASTEPVALYW